MSRCDRIESVIREAVPDAMIVVHNPDGDHFEAVVIAASFRGMSRLAQHRRVMGALTPALKEDVHAFSLKTFSMDEWDTHAATHPHIQRLVKEKYE